jgi:uncharacterized protein (DUF2147 family)
MRAMRWSWLLALLCASSAFADSATPIGVWRTIDDTRHAPRALVETEEHEGRLQGRVIEVFREPGEDPALRCTRCPEPRRDQPVLGMTILWGLTRHGERWDGGAILDPENGTIYRCSLRPDPSGDRLEVRGYLGVSLLGRTQIWERVAPPTSSAAASSTTDPAS